VETGQQAECECKSPQEIFNILQSSQNWKCTNSGEEWDTCPVKEVSCPVGKTCSGDHECIPSSSPSPSVSPTPVVEYCVDGTPFGECALNALL